MSKFFQKTSEVAEFVEIANDFSFKSLDKYLIQAERDLKIFFGSDFFNEIYSLDETSEELNSLKNTIKDFIASKALILGLAGINLDISNAGINEITPGKTENAAWYKIKDYRRDLVTNYNKALDYGFQLIEENSESLTKWDSSPINKSFSKLKIKSLSEFEEYFSLNGSYSTFYALQPFIREAQEKFIDPLLSDCLNNLNDSINEKIRAALVNLTVAEVAEVGIFKLENNGALVKIEVLPWEKVEVLSDDRLERLKEKRLSTANGYLNKLLQEVKKLDCYKEPEIVTYGPKKKKSGLYL